MAQRVISAVLRLNSQNFQANAQNAANGISDLERGLQRAGNQAENFKRGAVAGFAKVAAGVAGLVAAYGGLSAVGGSILEADDAFNRLSAKTGIVGQDLKGLKNVATDVFKNGFGESITQVADDIATLDAMFANQLDFAGLQSLTEGASAISDLWGPEVKEVGKAVKTMTDNFEGLTENNALDLMTTAFQRTGDYSDDLLDTFNEYSVYFSKLGLSAQEFTGILIKGSEAGAFNLDKVGDAVKELGIRVIDGSDSTKEGFKAIGLNASEMAAKFGAGGESSQKAFAATIAGLAAMKDPIKQNAAGVALFGTQWEDVREDVILSMTDSASAVEGFEGATKRAADTLQNSFGNRMKKTWREVQTGITSAFDDAGGQELLGALATKAESLVPIFENMVSGVVGFATSIKDNWPTIKGHIDTFKDRLVTVKDAALGVFGFFKDNWSLIGPLVYGVAGAILFFKTATVVATTATKVWKGVTTALTIAQALFNGTLALSPLGWVAIAIGAVIAVGVLLYQNWDTVRETAIKLWDKTKEVFGNIYDWGVSKIQPVVDFFKGLGDKFKDFKNAISNFKLPKWVSTIGETISGAAGKVKGWIDGSHATGLNSVPYDGYIAQLHKGEMVVPAAQSQMLRNQGITIDNIASPPPRETSSTPVSKVVNNADSTNSNSKIEINVYAQGLTTQQVVNELVPELKLVLANM